jgi:hypothetical protein
MVRGINTFKRYFEPFQNNYIIIGGTACDIIIEDAGFTPRATKDFDIVLIVEALSADFVKQFWQFIKDGDYEIQEKSADERKYYRFMKPFNSDFPYAIELFSRKPDLVMLNEPAYLTPIPVDDDLSSLSAILLNNDYYQFMIDHSTLANGIHYANIEALICLKAKAYLDIETRIVQNSLDDTKQLRKHKTDIFRLAVMLTGDDRFELPESITIDMLVFVNSVSSNLPDKAIYKEMGLGNISVQTVFQQIINAFKIEHN